MKKNLESNENLRTNRVVLIEKEANGQFFFEIGNEITIDFCEAVAIMMSKIRKDDPIWSTKIVFDRNINPVKSLYWLTGGHKEWRQPEHYRGNWGKFSAKFSERWSDKILKISKRAKTLSDVRSGFLKEVNFLDIYEFALKNEMLK